MSVRTLQHMHDNELKPGTKPGIRISRFTNPNSTTHTTPPMCQGCAVLPYCQAPKTCIFHGLMCQFVIPICSMHFVNHFKFSLNSCHMSYVVIVSCLNRPFPVAPLRGSGSLCCSYPAAGYGEQRRLGKEL